ncbi:MAG: secondary thiamine-phosphate synthase enzyme YjbQ [Kiritimatiellia bacterium]|nr:secondary thiamine-phosphate synthase enzyme YjbQ [Lentisphaerota bacterium]
MRTTGRQPCVITVASRQRAQFIDITGQIRALLREQPALADGPAITVFVPHTTAGITINENADPDVMADVNNALEKIAPWRAGYRHAEGNSAAHIKAILTGASARIPLENGRLALGTWQGIYFCEFDGPRQRQVLISG